MLATFPEIHKFRTAKSQLQDIAQILHVQLELPEITEIYWIKSQLRKICPSGVFNHNPFPKFHLEMQKLLLFVPPLNPTEDTRMIEHKRHPKV